MDATMAAIRRLGASTSIEQLAREIGVSKPVLYAEFGGKDGIADAVGEELARRAERDFIAQLAGRDRLDLITGAEAVIDTMFGVLSDESEIYGFIVRCVRVSDRRLLDNGFVRALDSRVRLISKLVAPATDAALVALLAHGMVGFVVFAVESWLAGQAPSRDELVEAVVDLFQIHLDRPPPPAVR